MPQIYNLVVQEGTRVETIGTVALPDDVEALAFGARMIRDIMQASKANFADWTLTITAEDQRLVGRIPFLL
jgi:hypothetical protein